MSLGRLKGALALSKEQVCLYCYLRNATINGQRMQRNQHNRAQPFTSNREAHFVKSIRSLERSLQLPGVTTSKPQANNSKLGAKPTAKHTAVTIASKSGDRQLKSLPTAVASEGSQKPSKRRKNAALAKKRKSRPKRRRQSQKPSLPQATTDSQPVDSFDTKDLVNNQGSSQVQKDGNTRDSGVETPIRRYKSSRVIIRKTVKGFRKIRSSKQALAYPEKPRAAKARIRSIRSKRDLIQKLRSDSKLSVQDSSAHAPNKAVVKKTSSMTHVHERLPEIAKQDIKRSTAKDLRISPIKYGQVIVPSLSYGLERVLFNPGVYHLQDPRSRVFNFDPYLQTIMPVADFDFKSLNQYITSSQDKNLSHLAKTYGKRYAGSSSSMTAVLAHFHFLLSEWRNININMLSKGFPDKELRSFTALQRAPVAIFLRWRDGSYAIDADKQFASSNILSMLGQSMEKLFTLDTNGFERYRKSNPAGVPTDDKSFSDCFFYSTMGNMLMRSQLDAYDPRLPGTGMFDLKTRAVVSIRMDPSHYEQGVGYQIKSLHGEWESYEREYFEMIRSAFLKYSLQVRMGSMDGIFVAFHNVERIFGFQYINLSELDLAIHGQSDTAVGDQEFKLSLDLLSKVLDKATEKFPETSLRFHFETRTLMKKGFMYIFAEPVTENQVKEIQSSNDAKIEEFRRNLLEPQGDVIKQEQLAQGEQDGWAEIEADVQDAIARDELSPNGFAEPDDDFPSLLEDDETERSRDANTDESIKVKARVKADDKVGENICGGKTDSERNANFRVVTNTNSESGIDPMVGKDHPQYVDEKSREAKEAGACPSNGKHQGKVDSGEMTNKAAGDAIEIRGTTNLKIGTSLEQHLKTPKIPTADDSIPGNDADSKLLAMTLTIRNIVNGEYVRHPLNLSSADKWEVEYSLAEVSPRSRAWVLYQKCQVRREKKLSNEAEDDDSVNYYIRTLRKISRKGALWRKEMDKQEKAKPKVVLENTGVTEEEEDG